MTRILIVGSAFRTLTDYLTQHGYDYIVLKDKTRTKFPDKRFKRRTLCDFSTKEGILATVDGIKKPIDGVIATYENYVLPTAWIAEHLNLPGISVESAIACTDKYLMRDLFATAPETISPEFGEVRSEEDVRHFATTHDFPLILKPANLAKSLLVTKSNNLDELLKNYQRTVEQIDAIYAKYSPHRQPKIVIEEFLEGPAFSVDAFTGRDGKPLVLEHVVDYQTGYDIGFDDNFHYSRILPSRLSPEDQAAIRHCAVLGITALGMKNVPAHAEVIMTPKGPRIIEIGARNGGYRERMYGMANGIDITGAAVALALGQSPKVSATKNESCAVLELFAKTPGKFSHLACEEELRNLPSFNYLSIKAKRGQFIGKAADGYKMAAVIILHHADATQFARDLEFVNTKVAIQTN